MNKNQARLRRAKSGRMKMRTLGTPRLSVHRSNQHLYAQVFSAAGDRVLAAASTLDKDLRQGLESTSNSAAASAVGRAVAEKAVAAGVTTVAFDRSGYKYHGRVQALAEAAREAGLKF